MKTSVLYSYSCTASAAYFYSAGVQNVNGNYSSLQILNAESPSLTIDMASRLAAANNPKTPDTLPEQPMPATDRIALASVEGIVIVKLGQVVRFEADGNYTTVVLRCGERHCVSRILKEFESLLPSERFFRVHQSHLVCLDAVCKFLREEGGILLMCDKTRIPVARRRKEDLLDWLKKGSLNLG